MRKILKKLFPESILRSTYSILLIIRGKWKQQSTQIPKHELKNRNIKNARLLPSREELLTLLPKNGVIAEIGVDKGDFSKRILQNCSPKKLHLVDIWGGSKRYGNKEKLEVYKKFENEIQSQVIEINLGLSTEVVNDFEDNYFDWIYIDTDHSYKTTIAELEMYQSKIKDGGIIAGHDYISVNWGSMAKYGVIEAVYKFCSEHDWEILYLTTELKINPSFAIRKITSS